MQSMEVERKFREKWIHPNEDCELYFYLNDLGRPRQINKVDQLLNRQCLLFSENPVSNIHPWIVLNSCNIYHVHIDAHHRDHQYLNEPLSGHKFIIRRNIFFNFARILMK